MTLDELQRELDTRDDGVLTPGNHAPGRVFCALEFESQVRGRDWSDAPITLPDLRPLNDVRWSSDRARTEALLPVLVAYWDWAEWTPERRAEVMGRVALETVRQIIAELPRLPESIRTRCRAAPTLAAAGAAAGAAEAWAAEKAAEAAAGAARAAAARAVEAAAEAAAWAAGAAAGAAEAWAAEKAADDVLRRACAIWIAAAA